MTQARQSQRTISMSSTFLGQSLARASVIVRPVPVRHSEGPPFRGVRHSEGRYSWSLHGIVLDIDTTRRLTLTITLTLTVSLTVVTAGND